jgi:hypothetical protein
MTALVPSRRHAVVDDDEIRTYAGIYVMKMMDLKPADGGMVFELPLPHELSPLDEVLVELESRGLVEMHRRKDRWDLTKAGLAHLATLIDEATDLMDEFDDDELPEVVAELRARNLDPLRARFLWGWYASARSRAGPAAVGTLPDERGLLRRAGPRPRELEHRTV